MILVMPLSAAPVATAARLGHEVRVDHPKLADFTAFVDNPTPAPVGDKLPDDFDRQPTP
ncbi:hypothetical protein [Methylobacterium sp. CM6257]